MVEIDQNVNWAEFDPHSYSVSYETRKRRMKEKLICTKV